MILKNVSKTIARKFSKHIHVSLKMSCNHIVDPLIFHLAPSSGQYCQQINEQPHKATIMAVDIVFPTMQPNTNPIIMNSQTTNPLINAFTI